MWGGGGLSQNMTKCMNEGEGVVGKSETFENSITVLGDRSNIKLDFICIWMRGGGLSQVIKSV